MTYFNESMTNAEARRTLFTVVEGKSKEETERIKQEYSKIIPIINKRELKSNRQYLSSE